MRELLFLPVLVLGCATPASGGYEPTDAAIGAPDRLDAGPNSPTVDASSPSLGGDSGAPVVDIDAACATNLSKATTTTLPVDIVWLVDNSKSMEPAVAQVNAGLNQFANLVGTKGLDYRVVMLSLRGDQPVTVGGKTRYPVCIAPPLAGGPGCADGARFLHSSVDIKSTQPLEQFLGTLGQTDGYRAGDERGGTPWSQFLRPEATKTIVVVTDDESRLSATDFEHFAGGANPNNSVLSLPPGLLDPACGCTVT
jgi:hypothetical protein